MLDEIIDRTGYNWLDNFLENIGFPKDKWDKNITIDDFKKEINNIISKYPD
ncbi:MAG: hypothetical protein ACTSPY_12125 [Candidatus Helarchaeota archaeon]